MLDGFPCIWDSVTSGGGIDNNINCHLAITWSNSSLLWQTCSNNLATFIEGLAGMCAALLWNDRTMELHLVTG